jgi:hypothetical protein
MKASVFLVSHVHSINGEDDEKIIGIYSTRDEAEQAITRASERPGFRANPEGFHIDEYEIGEDQWTEGYVSL